MTIDIDVSVAGQYKEDIEGTEYSQDHDLEMLEDDQNFDENNIKLESNRKQNFETNDYAIRHERNKSE